MCRRRQARKPCINFLWPSLWRINTPNDCPWEETVTISMAKKVDFDIDRKKKDELARNNICRLCNFLMLLLFKRQK